MIKIVFLIIICFVCAAAAGGLLFLRFYPSVGALPGKEERESFADRTKLYSQEQFHNEKDVKTMVGESDPSSDRKTPESRIPAEEPELLKEAGKKDLAVTWLGHSSFLLQTDGKNILVDPVLSERTSPVSFAGPKRFSDVPLSADEMPEIDILLISHDHYDHLDCQAIRALSKKTELFVVPLGVDAILRGWGVEPEKIRTLAWWESTEADGTTVTLTPSQHFTGRNPLKGNRTLWGGYYIKNRSYRIYYTGDGGYYDIFKRIRKKLGPADLMLAECGQYDPAWAQIHMFPEETVQAGLDMDAKWVIPIHWGAFCICNHAWDDSIIRMTAEAEKKELNAATPRIGQTVEYSHIEDFRERWWEEIR